MKEENEISSLLMEWYDVHHRCLPWRETSDPYAVWVSEIILQQTRVAQGLEYYRRFMTAFPDVEALALAEPDEVMRIWQGLGYYSRARNMQQAAQQVMRAGGFPRTYEGLLNLKGVGAYTAAAVGSFAFGLPLAAVDGNVCRVLSRLFDISDPIDSTIGKKIVQDLADELLPVDKSACFNQAMMEFGALQCVPSRPDCTACPLSFKCLSLASGMVERRPVKMHRTKVSERFFHYFYIHDTTSLYLHKRHAGDIWQGLYELPLKEVADADAEEVLMPVKSRKHVLSHQVIHATLYEQILPDPLPERDDYIIVPMEDLENYALPRLLQFLLE